MSDSVLWVEQVLKKDCPVGCRMIAKITGILKTTVQYILRDNLKKRKLCSHFVPYALTTEQQQQQQKSQAKNLMEMTENDPDLVDSINTGDESWCFTYKLLKARNTLPRHNTTLYYTMKLDLVQLF